MTTKELSKLSPEQKRVKIAEACPKLVSYKGPVTGELYWLHNGRCALFDPLNDLNAMHEAEKMITEKQGYNYICHLGGGGEDQVCWGEYWKCCHNTASQRADAFLLTI